MCRASNRHAFDESCISPYISQEPAGLSALLIDLPREVIHDVNTEILHGRGDFKRRARHVIVEDERIKFPICAALWICCS